MKQYEYDVNKEVALTLSCLDDVKKAKAPHYFVEKVLIEQSLIKSRKA